MSRDLINYGKLVDEAMHIIVFKVLKDVQLKGLPGAHHFFISFATRNPGVKISKGLASRYPKEMTIVVQYQYQDLLVDSKGFSVTLSFGGVKEKIYIPFSAITTFADPSVQFGLQFREADVEENDHSEIEIEIDDKFLKENNIIKPKVQSALVEPEQVVQSGKKKVKDSEKSNVVSLDKYRKKSK
jgi:hypothetical protein